MFEGLFQPTHLIIILVIVLIVFGPRRLPEIGGAVGKSIREFKRSTSEMTKEFSDTVNEVKAPVEEIRQHTMDARPASASASAQAADSGKICPKCSAGNASSSKFCGACGAQMA